MLVPFFIYNLRMPQSHQNWQYLGANGYIGAYTTTGGGGTPVIPRSDMDYLRLGVGRKPEAEYPDGYLGTIRTRRDDRGRPNSTSDKVLDSMKTRVGQRSYQRGVHRGERIDPSDYYYPDGFEPDISGLNCKPLKGIGIELSLQKRYECNDNKELIGALCFDKCPDGYILKDFSSKKCECIYLF